LIADTRKGFDYISLLILVLTIRQHRIKGDLPMCHAYKRFLAARKRCLHIATDRMRTELRLRKLLYSAYSVGGCLLWGGYRDDACIVAG